MTRYQSLARDMMLDEFNPASFTHHDHLGVAFELLKQCEFLEAANLYAKALRGFASSAGVPQKFNTTITVAFLSIVAERSKADQTFAQFMAKNADLLSKDLLGKWYSGETLSSDLARTAFIMPNAHNHRRSSNPN